MILPLLLATAIAPEASSLVGGWSPGESSCGSDRDISLEADGTYIHAEGEGVWTLAGDRLTFSSTGGDDFGRSEVVQIKVRSPVEMDMEWRDGARASFYRCP